MASKEIRSPPGSNEDSGKFAVKTLSLLLRRLGVRAAGLSAEIKYKIIINNHFKSWNEN